MAWTRALLAFAFCLQFALAAAEGEKKDQPPAKADPKAQPAITAADLAGRWRYSPEHSQGAELRANGTMTLVGTILGFSGDGRWGFDAAHQEVVFETQQVRRAYKVHWEDGKLVMYQGREVWRRGVNFSIFLAVPYDKMTKS